ncbi:hypothetical protein ZYGR_0AS03170 [Zygosaccharomyces rouxii]|uniref:Altered inheritance of mitochondria protein 44 n=1 Tax=Zygosaccharomyces rouxii TaxID=4956 RepID=A0A1Q3AGX1_ZYGRO|nr:hypothetical protein ZYGR_0AS03170 [Zygosaccharomyces rouxii]
MIIRAPTRTMTKSFNGRQMGFKFPSVESMPQDSLDEYHMNNHHLLNDNIAKSQQAHAQAQAQAQAQSHPHIQKPISTDEDALSNLNSDYTSGSNTNTNSGNSSNGYYSFANISDNTTPLANKTHSYPSSPRNNESNDGGKVSELMVPRDEHNQSSQKSVEPMEAIPEDNGFTSMSINVQSIPTADNFSFDIASSNSSKHGSTTDKPGVSTFSRTPSSNTSKSSLLSPNVSNPSLSSARLRQSKRRSQLKRSPSIRCKGGLLKYFQLLGSRIKKTLRKIKLALRGKNGKRQASLRGSSSLAAVSKAPRKHPVNVTRNSSKKELTSHLKRTNGYVSNLQRSMSQRSLRPLLEGSDNTTAVGNLHRPPPDTSNSDAFVTPPGSRIVRNPTTSLRRTPSSIRRAASVIRTPVPAVPPAAATPIENSVYEDTATTSPSTLSGSENRSGLVRSNGSKSLNSLIRQRSIVVKNKVIPLSMHQYSIREEDEDKERDNQFSIKPSSEYSLSPVHSASSEENGYRYESESEKSFSTGHYTDAYEEAEGGAVTSSERVSSTSTSTTTASSDAMSYVESIEPSVKPVEEPAAETNSVNDWDDIDESTSSVGSVNREIEEFRDNINHYFRCVISQRIKLRLQLAQYESSDALSPSYLDIIESLLKDYADESTAGKEPAEFNTIDEEEEAVPSELWSPRDSKTGSIRVNLQSPYLKRGPTQRSLISLKSRDVHRSLTLPIGIKV